jgi:(p)ppGpp synthase/HD superfamily hydrolase
VIRFEDLLEKVRDYNPDADVEMLRRAYVFSALEHKGQVRHSGEPYLVHPLEVATILTEMKMDVVTIAAGLLHDVVEDTLTTTERTLERAGFQHVRAWLDSPPQNRQESRVFALARWVLFKLPPFRYFFEREVFAVGER